MSDRQLDLGLGVMKCALVPVAPGAFHLPGFLLADDPTQDRALYQQVQVLLQQSPWRQMKTPGGRKIQVSMSACGALGWISDAQGYRYSATDPLVDAAWPAMPPLFENLATKAAAMAGYPDFCPDSGLLNRYEVGLTMGMHQDADERCFAHPIVSFSLGLDAAFRFGGKTRQSQAQTLRLSHGDAIVWGGVSRKYYHGISRIYPGHHPLLGELRINLTFRRAG